MGSGTDPWVGFNSSYGTQKSADNSYFAPSGMRNSTVNSVHRQIGFWNSGFRLVVNDF